MDDNAKRVASGLVDTSAEDKLYFNALDVLSGLVAMRPDKASTACVFLTELATALENYEQARWPLGRRVTHRARSAGFVEGWGALCQQVSGCDVLVCDPVPVTCPRCVGLMLAGKDKQP